MQKRAEGEFGSWWGLNNGFSQPFWKPVKLGLPFRIILSWGEGPGIYTPAMKSHWIWERCMTLREAVALSLCVIIGNIHMNILIFFSQTDGSLILPHVLWVRYVMCFVQWNVSRSCMCCFWVEMFKSAYVILQIPFPLWMSLRSVTFQIYGGPSTYRPDWRQCGAVHSAVLWLTLGMNEK